MIASVAAFAAWVGVSLIVLADGRLGLSAGLGLAAAGLAFIAWPSGGPVAAAAIAAGGTFAAARRWRAGPLGWNLMPAGSTPRLVMCVAWGLIALWLAASVMTGDGAPFRFAVLCTVALAGARVIDTREVAAATTSVAAMALALAVASTVADVQPSPWSYAAAAIVAVGVSWFPRRRLEPR